jgi:uncharacterized damage-inducible protein DinB
MNTTKFISAQYDMVTDWMMGIINNFTDDELKLEIAPGKNYALWIVCHLVASDDDFSMFMGRGGLLYPEYAELFSQGKKLIPFEQCPSPKDVRNALEKVIEKNKLVYSSLNDEELNEPHALMNDPENDFFKTKARVIMAWQLHQVYHTGQLASILSAAGKRVYG